MLNPTFEVAPAESETAVFERPKSDTLFAAAYGVLLLVCLSVWFLAVHAALWTDETLSYWQIAGGFKQIWARSIQGNSFAAYAYILWLTNTIFGSKEIILRIPSILAMLAATYVFYRCARELFDWDVSLIATAMFILPRGIAFAAIDVRPYAFALLVTNLAILMFLRWRKTGRIQYAAGFGIAAAGIFYFHYLFATILGAFAIGYVVFRRSSLRDDLRQLGVAAACFVMLILPVLPRLGYIFTTRTSHSFARAPHFTDALQVVNPGTWQLLILASALLVAAFMHNLPAPRRESGRTLFWCLLLGLFPIACLYIISVTTSVHVFIPRYLLVSVPGMALIWAWCVSLADSRTVRVLFCLVFVTACVLPAYQSPFSRRHEDSWKRSLAFADANAAEDHAPLLMCSPLVEADYEPMPAVASESVLYSPLSYYKVSAPVVPLPRSLTPQSEQLVDRFLLSAVPQHQRFLALVPVPSLPILDYLAYSSSASYVPRALGTFDDILVVEFDPRADGQ